MNATPTIRSSQPPRAARDLAGLDDTVERLFEAADAASVMEICELMLSHLSAHGRLCWRHRDDTAVNPAEPWLDLAEDPLSTRTLSLEPTDLPLSGSTRESLQWMGRLADIRLAQLAETSRLYEAISRLALAERLQRALYAIADQASAEHDMPQMMRPLQDMLHSLTWNLLQDGQPMMGSIDELRQQRGDRFVLFGPRCEHWLGVPMLRDGRVVGGIVVQSYRTDTHYSRHDL